MENTKEQREIAASKRTIMWVAGFLTASFALGLSWFVWLLFAVL